MLQAISCSTVKYYRKYAKKDYGYSSIVGRRSEESTNGYKNLRGSDRPSCRSQNTIPRGGLPNDTDANPKQVYTVST